MKPRITTDEETLRRSAMMRQWLPALILVVLGILSMGAMAAYQIQRGEKLTELQRWDNGLTGINERVLDIHERITEDSLKLAPRDSDGILTRMDSVLSMVKQLVNQLTVGDAEVSLPVVSSLRAKAEVFGDLMHHLRNDYSSLASTPLSDPSRDILASRVHALSDTVLMSSTSLRHDLLDRTEADLSKYHHIHTFITLVWVLAMIVALIGLTYSAHRSMNLTGALFGSERNFRLLFEDAPLAYQSLDSHGNILRVNRAWLDLTGYQMDKVIGKWFGSFLSAESANAFTSRFEIFKQAGEVHGKVFTLRRADQSMIEVSTDGRISSDSERRFSS